MLITTAHHPSLFDKEMLNEPGFSHWMANHLLHLAHSHVIITASGPGFKNGIEGMIEMVLAQDVREPVKMKLEREFETNGRVFPLPNDDTRKRYADAIDVVLVPCEQYRNEAKEMYGVDDSRVCDWRNYSSANMYGDKEAPSIQFTEYCAMGGQSIKAWKAERFEKTILRPLLRWAPRVWMIDGTLGKVVCEDRWDSWLATICMIFRSWIQCHVLPIADLGEFRIVTFNPDSWKIPNMDKFIKLKVIEKMRKDPLPDDDFSAWEPKFHVEAPAKGTKWACLEKYDAEHDRYLDLGVLKLLVTRGFDLLWGEHLRQGSVSIYYPDAPAAQNCSASGRGNPQS